GCIGLPVMWPARRLVGFAGGLVGAVRTLAVGLGAGHAPRIVPAERACLRNSEAHGQQPETADGNRRELSHESSSVQAGVAARRPGGPAGLSRAAGYGPSRNRVKRPNTGN